MARRKSSRLSKGTSLPLGERAGVRARGQSGSSLSPILLARARELRQTATDAETLLWKLIRNRQINGAKFRRQHPFGPYILDFYNYEARLAIELDGSGHAEPKQARHDAERTEALNAAGIRVIRFWNNQVLKETEGVLQAIWHAVSNEPSP